MQSELLDTIGAFLSGELSRDGLEAIYYHTLLRCEVERRKAAERETQELRRILAETISANIHAPEGVAV